MKYLVSFLLFLSTINLNAQTLFNLGMTTEVVGNKLRVNLFVSFDVADGLGSSNLRFDYGMGIENPTLLSHNLGTGYISVGLTKPVTRRVSFNTVFFGGTAVTMPAGADPVVNGFNVGIIEFDITDNTQTPDLTWASPVATTDGFVTLTANNINNNLSVVLPVELITFDIKSQQQQTHLSWATSSESGNAGFEIQRSKDGNHWANLGFVKGHQYSNTRKDYDFIDKNPYTGENYYRLKQMDLDGKFEYSDIVSITFYGKLTGQIFPNPSSDWINIEDAEVGAAFQIRDGSGKHIKSGQFNGRAISIHELESGIYYFQVGQNHWTFVKL